MTIIEQLKERFRRKGIISIRDPECDGVPGVYFSRLCAEGFIERIGQGVYSCPSYSGTEFIAYAEAAAVVPQGVACLFSSLKFHELTLENPHRLHLAIPKGARIPKNNLPVNFYHFAPDAYAFGIDDISSKDGMFKVYCVEKTLADCFKFRNEIGLDVAVAALREACGKRRIDHEKLRRAMEICRMKKVMRPYLDSFFV